MCLTSDPQAVRNFREKYKKSKTTIKVWKYVKVDKGLGTLHSIFYPEFIYEPGWIKSNANFYQRLYCRLSNIEGHIFNGIHVFLEEPEPAYTRNLTSLNSDGVVLELDVLLSDLMGVSVEPLYGKIQQAVFSRVYLSQEEYDKKNPPI